MREVGLVAKMPTTQGCASNLTHIGHMWKATVHGKRGNPQERWCPGRVRCVRCRRVVFTTMTTPVPGSRTTWVCTGKC